jgi:hypothetical protein
MAAVLLASRETPRQAEEDLARIASTRLTPTPDATAGKDWGDSVRDFYHVEVHDERGMIVAINRRSVSGRDIGPSEEATIHEAIRQLCGFIGLSPLVGEASNGDAVPSSPERKTEDAASAERRQKTEEEDLTTRVDGNS